MKVEGELNSFYPPDLLIFLANLKKEGILTVAEGAGLITLTFSGDHLVDAQSETADNKILKSLFRSGTVNRKTYQYLCRARQETNISVRQILEKFKLLAAPETIEIYTRGVKQAVFEFFMLKKGQYRFTQMAKGRSLHPIQLNPSALALEIVQKVDEFEDQVQQLSSLDRLAEINPAFPGDLDRDLDSQEKWLVREMKGQKPMREILCVAPQASYKALNVLKRLVDKGAVRLLNIRAEQRDQGRAGPVDADDMVFREFRNASRHILASSTLNEKMRPLFGYCKTFFNHFFIVSMTPQEISRLIYYYKSADGILNRTQRTGITCRMDDEAVFAGIIQTGTAFFGKYFDTRLFDELERISGKQDCAVIPYRKTGPAVHFLYVVSDHESFGQSLFKYLEIMSWMVNPRMGFRERAPAGQVPAPQEPPAQGPVRQAPAGAEKKLKQIIQTVNDLPPMPTITTRILTLASNPDYETDDLVALITQDPSLTATLIKVGNSVLYKGVTEISTVRQAAGRLGINAIKSIVVASATKALFSGKESEFNILGHPLWVHSKECGIIARRIAITCGYRDPEEAFVGGMLHDIGKLAILVGDRGKYTRIKKEEQALKSTAFRIEMKVLGFAHTQVGALLMKKWKMPLALQQAVQFHHFNELKRPPGISPLSKVIALADFYAHAAPRDPDEDIPFPSHIQSLNSDLGIGDTGELMRQVTEDLSQKGVFD